MRKEIVSLILEKDGKFLIEKRKQSKFTSPSSIIFPAGHVENGETKEQALEREMKQELGIKIYNLQLVYKSDFDCEELQTIFWYKCEKYEGNIENNEAEKLLWIKPMEVSIMSHEMSRKALSAYLKSK